MNAPAEVRDAMQFAGDLEEWVTGVLRSSGAIRIGGLHYYPATPAQVSRLDTAGLPDEAVILLRDSDGACFAATVSVIATPLAGVTR